MKKPPSKKFKKSLPQKKVIFKKPKEKKESKPFKFPSISRIIPELSFSPQVFRSIFLSKYFLVSFVSTFISVAVVMQGIDLTQHVRQLQQIQSERQRIQEEILYWEEVTTKHPDFRDAYFKLALLEYRLGNTQKATEYVQKTLRIDPNYKSAQDFSKRVAE